MTHDPMCTTHDYVHEPLWCPAPSEGCEQCRCICDRIAVIRADEREQAGKRVAETYFRGDPDGSPWLRRSDAIRAARGEQP